MRKWNKLLALMLAMAMVLGMATTAFAAEDDAATADGGETPVEETNEDAAVDETTPAEGEETAPVARPPSRRRTRMRPLTRRPLPRARRPLLWRRPPLRRPPSRLVTPM